MIIPSAETNSTPSARSFPITCILAVIFRRIRSARVSAPSTISLSSAAYVPAFPPSASITSTVSVIRYSPEEFLSVSLGRAAESASELNQYIPASVSVIPSCTSVQSSFSIMPRNSPFPPRSILPRSAGSGSSAVTTVTSFPERLCSSRDAFIVSLSANGASPQRTSTSVPGPSIPAACMTAWPVPLRSACVKVRKAPFSARKLFTLSAPYPTMTPVSSSFIPASLTLSVTQSIMGSPSTLHITFGPDDFILLPSPAASIIALQFMETLLVIVVIRELSFQSAGRYADNPRISSHHPFYYRTFS